MSTSKAKTDVPEAPEISEAVKAPEPEAKPWVKIRLPRDEQLKNEAVFVGINGKTYAVPRGKEVSVPPEVYEVLENSMNQDIHTQDVIDSYVSKD